MYSLPDTAGFEQTQAQVRVSRTLNTSCSSMPDAHVPKDQTDHAGRWESERSESSLCATGRVNTGAKT